MNGQAKPNANETQPLRLRLYIAGDALNSIAAVANLRAAIAEFASENAQLEIVDILTDPMRGLQDGVFVTPMLVKAAPLPERRILGSLQDRSTLLAALGFVAGPS